jgi:hypothetical protein
MLHNFLDIGQKVRGEIPAQEFDFDFITHPTLLLHGLNSRLPLAGHGKGRSSCENGYSGIDEDLRRWHVWGGPLLKSNFQRA